MIKYYFNRKTALLFLLFFLTLTNNIYSNITPDIIKKYAPVIYLHQDENYMPSSVDFFLKYVATDFSEEHLTTINKINCPSCDNLTFFNGQNVSNGNVPIYAMVVPKPKQGKNITDVFYWSFYPYNRGKRVCISPIYIGGNCWGKYSTFGHHVGDWEHVTIRFKENKPIKIYLSQHANGEVINWGDYRLEYQADPNLSIAQLNNPENYTHPVVYSAKGSHGLYSKPGDFIYQKIFNGDHLTDKTSKGAKWQTWENIKIINWQESGAYNNDSYWLNYNGRWGNYKDGCTFLGFDFEGILKNCILNSGPYGPNMKSYTNPYQNCEDDEFISSLASYEKQAICSA